MSHTFENPADFLSHSILVSLTSGAPNFTLELVICDFICKGQRPHTRLCGLPETG